MVVGKTISTGSLNRMPQSSRSKNSINLNNEFEITDSIISSFVTNFNSSKDTEDMPFYDDYSFLLFLFIALIKQYNHIFTLRSLSPNHFQIIIDKDIPPPILDSFLKIFEELTLSTVNIKDNEMDYKLMINLLF